MSLDFIYVLLGETPRRHSDVSNLYSHRAEFCQVLQVLGARRKCMLTPYPEYLGSADSPSSTEILPVFCGRAEADGKGGRLIDLYSHLDDHTVSAIAKCMTSGEVAVRL